MQRLLLIAAMLAVFAGGCVAEDPTDERRIAAEAAAESIASDWVEGPLAKLAGDEMGGRGNLTAGGKKARDYLVSQLEAFGLTPRGRDGWLQPFKEGVNIVAELRGSDSAVADDYVLVSAHYDHLGTAGEVGSQCIALANDTICNGAGDNAAGVAAVLAIARAVAAMKIPPRRSMLFVFWDAEEDGLLGSRHFAETDPIVPLEKIVSMFSVDQIATEIVPGLVPLFALAVGHSPELRAAVHANKDSSPKPAIETFPVSDFFTGSAQGGRSDHLHFRLAGVPVVFFSSGAPPEYHTAADELAIVQKALLLPITKTILRTAADLANAAGRPSFVASPAPHLDDARALVAMGEFIVANPKALGPGSEGLVGIIEVFLKRLRGYLDKPPETATEWGEYESFVRSVIDTVYIIGGR